MNDHNDSIRAIETTVHTLKAAGVDSMAIAVSLATLSVHVYKEIAPTEALTDDDLRMLFKSLVNVGK